MFELNELMAQIGSKFSIETVPVKIGDDVLKIVQLKDYEEYILDQIDANDPNVTEAPFWAKLWESSFLLAYFLGRQPVKPNCRILEIGAGIGIVGVYAALCGHKITITDINEDALMFARANALLNGLTDLEIRRLDWSDPNETSRYDVIVGSEVVYDRRSYPLLVDFLHRTLTPDGVIFLAKHAELNAPTFFTELVRCFEFKKTSQTLRTDGEAQEIELFAVRHKRPNNV
jgi:2-polyprenyl-3-methyl-5-hydroxy-6-metoxy-1,4-benzoquinol methylase